MHSTIHSSGLLNASRFQAAQLGRLASERANRNFILPVAAAAFILSAYTTQLPPGERLNGHAAHEIDAVKKWRFRPIIKDGQPVEQRALQRVIFKPRDTTIESIMPYALLGSLPGGYLASITQLVFSLSKNKRHG